MQFDCTTTDGDRDATDAVAPGTSSTIYPCGGVDPYMCTCPHCGDT